jgi:multidrug efflux pump subunit AcrA (membrane-fusion protein)
MFKQKRSFPLATLFLVGMLILTSCAPAASSSTTTSTGVGAVTEITAVTTVQATGSITPLRLASIAWKTSGTVADVKVQLGQAVSTNEILMSIDPATVPDSLRSSLQNLVEMTSPASIAAAQLAVVTADENLITAQNNRNYLNGGYSQAIIDDAYAKMVLADVNLSNAQERYDKVADLSVGNENRASAYTALYSAQTAYDSAKRMYVIYDSYEASANDIAMADANVALAKAQLEEAKNYLSALNGGQVPDTSTGASLQKLYQARMTVDEINLRAPFDGIIGAIYSQTGDVVSANSNAVLVINRSKLFVTVNVEESKIIQLAIGDKAIVTLEVLPKLDLTGHVIAIDPVGVVNQGVVYYSVKVELDQADPQIPLDATADVTIQAGDAKQVLAVPVTSVQSDTTGEFVLVYATDGSTRRVNIVSGLIQADDTVVVTGDLQVGDEVMLVESTTTTSSDTNGPQGGGDIFRP